MSNKKLDKSYKSVLYVSASKLDIIISIASLIIGLPIAIFSIVGFINGYIYDSSYLALISSILIFIGLRSLFHCVKGVPVIIDGSGIMSNKFGGNFISPKIIPWSEVSDCFILRERTLVIKISPGSILGVGQFSITPGSSRTGINQIADAIARWHPRLTIK